MRAVIVESPGKLVVKDISKQTIGDYEVLVKTEACSLCNATDMKLMEGRIPWQVEYPGILGHESVGTIIEVGSKVRNFKVGDRVLRVMAKVPGYSSFWGGLAEFGAITDTVAATTDGVTVSPGLVHKGQQTIPKNIDPVVATQLITLKETLSFLRRIKLNKNHSLLIMGTGPVGLSFVYLARNITGSFLIVVLGRRDESLRRAQVSGAHFTVNTSKGNTPEVLKKYCTRGFDFVIDAVGSAELIRLGLNVVSDNGKLAVYGVGDKQAEDLAPLLQDKRILQIQPEESEAHNEILQLLRNGEIEPSRFITHVLSLDEIEKGFELIKNKQAIKIVLKI